MDLVTIALSAGTITVIACSATRVFNVSGSIHRLDDAARVG